MYQNKTVLPILLMQWSTNQDLLVLIALHKIHSCSLVHCKASIKGTATHGICCLRYSYWGMEPKRCGVEQLSKRLDSFLHRWFSQWIKIIYGPAKCFLYLLLSRKKERAVLFQIYYMTFASTMLSGFIVCHKELKYRSGAMYMFRWYMLSE